MKNSNAEGGDSEYSHFLKNIGTQLHRLRNERNAKLTALAIDLGISHSIISRIENGRYDSLSFNLLKKFIGYYQLSMEDFLSTVLTQHKHPAIGSSTITFFRESNQTLNWAGRCFYSEQNVFITNIFDRQKFA